MKHRIDRRGFLKTGGALGAGVSLAALGSPLLPAAEAVRSSSPHAEKIGWLLSCQLYTFRRFSFYEALEKIASLGIRYVEPCFFLRLSRDRPGLNTNESLSAEVRKEFNGKMADHGIKMATFYTDLGNREDDCRKKFDFAKEMGAETLVAEPPAEAFDLIEKLCEEYKIDLAIHNHPKSPSSKYWNPGAVLKVCQGRGKRIGACCDTGHWVRSGLDPVACLKKLQGRIVGFHLKDVVEWGNPSTATCPWGPARRITSPYSRNSGGRAIRE